MIKLFIGAKGSGKTKTLIELANNAITWYQSASYSVASGDVVIAPSADGFKLYIYYYDHNSQVFGAYVADCIKD